MKKLKLMWGKIKSLLGLNNTTKCSCGRFNECINKIYVSERGTLFRSTKGILGCGEMEKKIKECAKLIN